MDKNIDVLNNDFKALFGKTSATVECNIDTASKGGVGKLLSVSACVKSATVDKSGDCAKVSATLNCKTVFLNKVGEFDSYDYLCDFTAMVTASDNSVTLQNFDHLWAECWIADTDSSVVGDIIKIQSVVDLKIFGIYSDKCECMLVAPDEVICKRSKVTVQSLGNIVNKMIDLEETFETGCTVDKILFYDVNSIVTMAKAMDDKCLVSGNICGTLVYLSEGIVTTKTFTTPFSEDIECVGLTSNDKVEVCSNVNDCQIVLTGLEGDNVVLLQIKVDIKTICFKQCKQEIIVDAFSPEFAIKIDDCKCAYNVLDKTYNLFDKIACNAKINDEMMSASKIISTTLSRNMVVNTYYDNDKIVVEGVLAFSVIYQDIEENVQSIFIELPYSLQFEEKIECDTNKLFANAVIDNVYSKLKRDREFEIMANINIVVQATSSTNLHCVKNVEIGEKKKNCNYGIVIYNCGTNDDMWDVAKAVGAPMENIMLQNPELDSKDLAGKKVIYYRQLAN